MRVLRLDGSNEEHKRAFLHIHAGLLSAEVRGIEQIRRVGKIIDKLEAIGSLAQGLDRDPQTGASVSVTRFVLSEKGGELWMEGAEYEEIRSRMNATAWLPAHARFVARTFEILDGAAEEDPGKPKLLPEPQEQAS